MKNFLLCCPGTYLWSRVIHRRQWKTRCARLALRMRWGLEDWTAVCRDERLCEFVLRCVEAYFDVDWRQLRPNDRIYGELQLPGTRLHRIMRGEFFDHIGIFIESHFDVETLKPPTQIDTVQEQIAFLEYVQANCPQDIPVDWHKWMRIV